MSVPSKMKAIKVLEAKKAAVVEVPVPTLLPEYILVKVCGVSTPKLCVYDGHH